MADIWAQYHQLARKNREELEKCWSQQTEESTTVVTTVKLEAEIATYHRLLDDGKDFNLGDALNSSDSMQTTQKTTTCRVVDGKVLSQTYDTKVLRHSLSKQKQGPFGKQEANKKFISKKKKSRNRP
ncbi:hypothetical protein P7K49_028563 [Saguinus oedipus]|uniref:Uncharacterized protein n=1 Tax=Saguinus oedipus TaxID=9490 RepID=A0ABQ9U5K1_SAGOE|nr:hypothetical protein P7K49_028563 [Saguinus oedipus]